MLKWKRKAGLEYQSEDGRFKITRTDNDESAVWELYDKHSPHRYDKRYKGMTFIGCKDKAREIVERDKKYAAIILEKIDEMQAGERVRVLESDVKDILKRCEKEGIKGSVEDLKKIGLIDATDVMEMVLSKYFSSKDTD